MQKEAVTEGVEEALAAYAFGEIYGIAQISQGFANINFRADTQAGRFLVRVCRKQPSENIEKEMQLMETLKKHGFPAAFPVARTDGQLISWTRPYPVVVYTFIDGYHPQPAGDVIPQIAAALAGLHRIPVSETPQKTNAVYPEWCLAQAWAAASEACLDSDTGKMWLAAFEAIAPFLEIALPTGLIHADLFPDNTLFAGGRLAAILDFEEFAIDHFLFDIGMTINGFCVTGNRPDQEKIAAFLKAYERRRPLNPDEKNCLETYIAWTALAMACWHLDDCREAPKPGQKARIRELTERARQWLNRF